ncbi:MAG: hypothetical protein QXZ39_00100 [Desulfurococcaceae archaeon]
MKVYLKLRVKSSDQLFIEALNSSLKPDNVSIPEGLDMNSYVSRDEYVFEIVVKGYEKFNTLKGTVDELLFIIAPIYELKNLKHQ